MRTIIVILLICSVSCDLNMADRKLGDKAFYKNEGIGRRSIVSTNSTIRRINIYSDVVGYDYNSDFIIAKQVPNRQNYIIDLGFDLYNIYTSYSKYIEDTTILRKQEWKKFKGKIEKDSSIYIFFKSRKATSNNTPEDIRIREAIADSLINYDPYYQRIFANDTNYWVIYNPTNSLIGPLTREEFETTRKVMNIPEKLKLE